MSFLPEDRHDIRRNMSLSEFISVVDDKCWGGGLFINMAEGKSYEDILEVGGGLGYISYAFKKNNININITLSDISKRVLEKAKILHKETEITLDHYSISSLEYLNFKKESFDLVVGRAILHHIDDLDKGCSEIYRVLKNGGAYIGSGEISSGKLWDKIHFNLGNRRKIISKYKINEKTYTEEEWSNAFNKAGFKSIIIKHNRSPSNYKTFSRHWMYYKLLSYIPKKWIKYYSYPINIILKK